MTRNVGDPGDPPSPRHSPHPIPLIPIWRGFELFFFIPSNARDPYNLELCWENDGDDLFPNLGDVARSRRCLAPLPLPPVLPNFTQGYPMSPKPGVPGKPGFGLLGWKLFVG
jgi:hypothetical protein